MKLPGKSDYLYQVDLSLTTADRLIHAEQQYLVRNILPWIGAALLLAGAATLIGVLRNPSIWQLWIWLLFVLIAGVTFFVAWTWNATGKSSESRFLVLFIVFVVMIPLPLLISDLIIVYVILALLAALLAGILLSLRAGLSTAVAVTLIGVVIYFVLQPQDLIPVHDVGGEITDLIDILSYLFTLFLATYMISLNYEAKTRALRQLIVQAQELQDVNGQLKYEIRQRGQIEQQQERLIAELEAKNRELEHFTYAVSHDLKSPLITIQGFLGYLENNAINGNKERLHEDIKHIRHAASMMYQLLEDLLELSRVGRFVNPPEEVIMSQVVAEAQRRVRGLLDWPAVQLSIEPNLPDAYGDKQRLVEVWQNLLENAMKFMGNQPAPQVTIGGQARERETVYFVKDNGIGVEPRYRESIFDLFQRLDAKIDGTGIGLALVKRIVELHGGQVWLESDGKGHGSTFFFSLPNNMTPDSFEQEAV